MAFGHCRMLEIAQVGLRIMKWVYVAVALFLEPNMSNGGKISMKWIYVMLFACFWWIKIAF